MSTQSTQRVALVTGGSRGIGAAISKRLGKDGYRVIVNYHSDANAANDVVKAIKAGGGEATAIQGDISTVQACQKLVEDTISTYGRLDTLVLNAGWLMYLSIEKTTEESYSRAFDQNVKGPMFTVQAALPHLTNGARIIFISTSVTAFSNVSPPYFLYAATKGALEQMSRVLAKDLGPRGITVNTIAPGPTATEAFFVGKSEEMLNTIANFSPMSKIGQPEDIARAVSFLAGDDGQWVSGQRIQVNGAMAV